MSRRRAFVVGTAGTPLPLGACVGLDVGEGLTAEEFVFQIRICFDGGCGVDGDGGE